MHALARQLVGGEEGAEDLVQETWLRVLRRGPRDPGRAKGWLATVLRNVSVSKARAEGRRAAREREVAPREAIESTADVNPAVDAMMVTVPMVSSSVWIKNAAFDEPLGTKMSTKGVPGVCAASEIKASVVSALSMRTVTPPCWVSLRIAPNCRLCRPEPMSRGTPPEKVMV